MSRRLDCEEVLESLEAHLDGDLDGAATAAVEAHVAGCADCAAELELAAAVCRELRALPRVDAPPAVLRAVFRQAGEARRFRWRPAAPVRPAWAALAAAVFAAVIVAAGLRLGPFDSGLREPQVVDAVADAEVVRATEEARFALAYVARVSRRTGLKLRQDVLPEHLVDPSVRSLTRALVPHPKPAAPTADEAENGAVERERS